MVNDPDPQLVILIEPPGLVKLGDKISEQEQETSSELHANTKLNTVCPRRLDPFFIVKYYIKWAKASWTDGTYYIHI